MSARDKQEEAQLYSELRTIVGAIVTLAEPLSRNSLAVLLNVQPETVALRVKPLYSVLQVPDDGEAPIRPLHLSFSEYLTSQEVRDQPFAVDGPATQNML